MSTATTKSRPILFSGPMVRAILDGRKTQTRRVVKLKDVSHDEVNRAINRPTRTGYFSYEPSNIWHFGHCRITDDGKLSSHFGLLKAVHCPYGIPGDELWVRETWGEVRYVSVSGMLPRDSKIVYRADEPIDRPIKWSPSIHMPRWASRITLTVKAVRVERLQDISEADAYAEGCGSYTPAYVSGGEIVGADGVLPSDEFRDLWESINGPDSRDANPWVWVVEFERKAVTT